MTCMFAFQIYSSKVSRDTLYEAVREVLQGSQTKTRKYELWHCVCVSQKRDLGRVGNAMFHFLT